MRSALGLVLLACACAGPSTEAKAPPQAAPQVAQTTPTAASALTSPVPAVETKLVSNDVAETLPVTELGAAPEIDARVAAAIAAQQLPGAVVAIGHRDGLVFLHAYGERAVVPAHEPMTLDTIFDLASLTKSLVTAPLVMELVERGRVDLDARASTYLPELRAYGHADISVRQLLLHSAGLPAENALRDYAAGPAAGLRGVFASRQLMAAGREFHYSDLGYVILGALIERVTGEKLDALANREIFAPLALHDTCFRPAVALRPRIAPTEMPDAVRKRIDPNAASEAVIRGDVHDPRAFLLGGVAGNAGAFTTASDLARFARMLLGAGELEGARVLATQTVATMTAPNFIGDGAAVRGLGWDMRSEYSGLRGARLSYRAYGHGGYTGTALWIDPDQDLFVILLSNRVHPNGKGHVIQLGGDLANAAALRFGRAPQPASCAKLSGHVETGIDVLQASGFAALAGKRIGLLANDASRTRDGKRTIDVLRAAPGVTLAALFAAEHGLDHAHEGRLDDGTDSASALRVYSLYGKTRKPTPEMLRGLDVIVFDLQDAGVRFFTYLSTLTRVLEAAASSGTQVLVLDRPNPLGATLVEGPLLEPERESFVNYHELPLRHGMTAGELARMLNDERKLHAKLDVVAMRGYARELQFAQTGVPWLSPSPNLATLDAAELYPATGLIEGANVSVGRGTDRPFAFVGAPWLDAEGLVQSFRATPFPGVEVSALDLTPRADRFAGQLCHGVALRVTDHASFFATRFGFVLAAALLATQHGAFHAGDMGALLGNQHTLAALLAGASETDLERQWEPELMRFSQRRERYLLYPSCDGAQPARD